MFCRDCGAGISGDSKFCKECGAKIGGSVKTMALTVQDLQPVAGDLNQERLAKLLDMAFWHNDAGNFDAAIKACEAALVINPASTTAHSLLASIYEKKGEDDKAIAHLETVLDINPDSVADQTKLEQLQRGEHVRAIQPPSGYRWIPPALGGIASIGPRLGIGGLLDRKVGSVRLMPLVYSGVATLAVLGIGVAAIRTQDKSTAATPSMTHVVSSYSTQPYSPPAVSDPRLAQAFAPTHESVVSTPTSPPEATAGKPTTKKSPDIGSTPDVFSASDDPNVRQIFNAAEQRVLSQPAGPRHGKLDDGGTGAKALPPLKAIPLTSGTVAPAAVELPAPAVTTAKLPTHTVMVSNVGGNADSDSPQQVAAPAPAPQPAAPSSDGGLVPVVRVTVHDDKSAESSLDTEINRGSAPSNVPSIHNDAGQAYQDYALSLQHQGDFKGAKAAYEKAIRTYKSEIRAGHDGDDVERGLQACQTGLEICQQSL